MFAFDHFESGHIYRIGFTWAIRKPGNTGRCGFRLKASIGIHYRTEEDFTMKPSTNDKTTGKLHEVKGAIKQKAGELTKNADLEAEGQAEKTAGKVQNFVGKVEKAIGN
jgi:uncharacterized protein YjbJ (UPF0337 family)